VKPRRGVDRRLATSLSSSDAWKTAGVAGRQKGARPMTLLDATEVAKLLAEYGQRTALAGGNPYRAKAYLRAAESLTALAEPLDCIIDEGRLREIPGVGEAIADIITRLHRTGTHPFLERMRKEIPAGVLEMLSVPGLRPDKVLTLYKKLGIASLDELEVAARQDRIKSLKGLGPALQRKVLQGLEIRAAAFGGRHMHRAAELVAAAEKNLRRALPDIQRIAPAGDFRRGCELMCDVSLVAEDTKLQADQDKPAVGLPDRSRTFRHQPFASDRLGGTFAAASHAGREPRSHDW
jgi:DNA polymerase (family X)